MAFIEILGLWKKTSKSETEYLTSGKMSVRDFKLKLQKAFEGLSLDEEIYVTVFNTKERKTDRSPHARLQFSIKDRPQEQPKDDVPW